MEKKFCKGCKEVLSILNFAKSANVKDGYENKCKECRRERRREFNKKPCKRCGNVFKSANSRTVFCSLECSGKVRRLDHEFVKESFKQISDLRLISSYEGKRKRVSIECNKCSYVFEALPDNVLSNKSGCPKCYGNILKTTEQFVDEVKDLTDNEYELLTEYKGNKIPVMMKHKICGHEYNVTPHKFITGRRCPACNSSHGELYIRNYLIENGIEFKQEYRILECKRNRPLPFDFAIFDQEKLSMLIEFDGEQHFKQVFPENGRSTLKYVQENDRIKNKYCEENNIPLLRIPYYEKENIPEILDNIFTMKIPSQA